MDALCRIDKAGSPANPNCATSLFVVASLAVFSCQRCWPDSDLICFARAMFVCLRFLTWNRCFFLGGLSWAFGVSSAFWARVVYRALFGRVLCWFIACLWFDLFFFEVLCSLWFGDRPLCGMFFCWFFCVTCCSNLLHLSSSRAYLRSHLSHSFQMRSCSCSKFAAPSPSSSIAVSSVVLPMIISLESFFTLSRHLFSSTSLSYAAGGVTRTHSRHFMYSWMPEFSGHWSDAVWYWRAFVRSSTVAYSESIVLTVGFGTSSRVW